MDATPASAATPDLAAASYGETIPAVESARRDYMLGLHPVAASSLTSTLEAAE